MINKSLKNIAIFWLLYESIYATLNPTRLPIWQRGYSFAGWWYDAYEKQEAKESLENLSKTGTKWLSLIITWYQDNIYSAFIYQDKNRSPSDFGIKQIIQKAHDLGMQVLIKLHVDCQDGSWRGYINPQDVDSWFLSYSEFVLHYAKLAQEYNVGGLCIGCELEKMVGYTEKWLDLIQKVREVYFGFLTYAANWDNYQNVKFWKALDYIGINAYFPLSDKKTPSTEELKNAWANILERIEDWLNKEGLEKRVIFTEVGYRSIDYCAKEPWNWQSIGEYNQQGQKNCYQALLSSVVDRDWFFGVYFWYWRTDLRGDCNDTDYTVYKKQAENVLRSWYKASEDGFLDSFSIKLPQKDFYLGKRFQIEVLCQKPDGSLAINYKGTPSFSITPGTINITQINRTAGKLLVIPELSDCGSLTLTVKDIPSGKEGSINFCLPLLCDLGTVDEWGMLKDSFDFKIDKADLDWFVFYWKNKEIVGYKADFGSEEYSGYPPHIISPTDGKLDFEDLMIFVVMWYWNNKTEIKNLTKELSGQINLKKAGDFAVELYLEEADTICGAKLQVYFDASLVSPEIIEVTPNAELVFTQIKANKVIINIGKVSGTLSGKLVYISFKPKEDKAISLDVKVLADLRDSRNKRIQKEEQIRIQNFAETLKNLIVYPNPARDYVTFDNLTKDVRIKIYNIAGDLVYDSGWIEPIYNGVFGRYRWDMRDIKKKNISSGIYIYAVLSKVDKKIGHIVVIK